MNQPQNQPVQPNPAKKGGSLVWAIIIIILVVLGLMIGGGYFIYKKYFKKPAVQISLTIPDNCPKNIPIYPKSRVVKISCKPEASSIESAINVEQKTVKEWYLKEIPKAGWTIRAEDTGSYLFDNNNNEIGKVSFSSEKKNTLVKFLTAKKSATAPTAKKSSGSAKNSGAVADISDALTGWDDYFESIPPDYSLPIDDIFNDWPVDWPSEDPVPEDEIAPPDKEASPEETSPPEEEITPEPEITEPPAEPTPNCWVDDKGNEYCS